MRVWGADAVIHYDVLRLKKVTFSGLGLLFSYCFVVRRSSNLLLVAFWAARGIMGGASRFPAVHGLDF